MIIGLSGFAGSGKDEVAKILVEEHEFARAAFADPIRQFLTEINPMVNEHFNLQSAIDVVGWDNAKKSPEIRRLMQDLGVGARKLFGEDFWIKQLWEDLAETPTIYHVVISDVRFINEAEAIKKVNGKVIRVVRPGVDAVNSHVSETELDDYAFDTKILNMGTLDDLRSTVRKLMESLDGNKMH